MKIFHDSWVLSDTESQATTRIFSYFPKYRYSPQLHRVPLKYTEVCKTNPIYVRYAWQLNSSAVSVNIVCGAAACCCLSFHATLPLARSFCSMLVGCSCVLAEIIRHWWYISSAAACRLWRVKAEDHRNKSDQLKYPWIMLIRFLQKGSGNPNNIINVCWCRGKDVKLFSSCRVYGDRKSVV